MPAIVLSVCLKMLQKLSNTKLRLSVALLIMLQFGATAQVSHLVTHFSRKDYKAGNQNWSLDIDNRGYVYAGNNNGLLVYDGIRWKLYQMPGQLVVRSVMIARDRKIYSGSYEEFGYWDYEKNGQLVYHTLKPLLHNYNFHNEEIWKIVELNGKIYFQSFSSLFVYDHKSVKPIPLKGNIVFLLKAANRMFVQTVNGSLFEIINDGLVAIPDGEKMAGCEVKTILSLNDNTYLIGTTSSGLFRFDGKSIVPWESAANELLKQYQINNGIIRDSTIVFGTIVKGIVILDMKGNLLDNLHSEKALQDNTVLALCCDNQKNLWIGLDRGIDLIEFDRPVDLYLNEEMPTGSVYSAASDGKTLYIGTNRGVSMYFRSGERYVNSGFIPNSQGQVWELNVLDGQLFCGHTNGTYIIDNGRFNKISDIGGGYAAREFFFSGQYYLIQSTYTSLVIFKKAGQIWQFSHIVKGFIEPSSTIEPDHLGNIWIGQAVRGLYRLRLNAKADSVTELQTFSSIDGFPAKSKIGVYKLESRVVFTTGERLYTWDDLQSKIIPFTAMNDQLQEFAAAVRIVPAGENKYWFINKNDLALFEVKTGRAGMIYRLRLDEYEVSMVENSENVVVLNDDETLICLDNGFAIVHLSKINTKPDTGLKLVFRDIVALNASGDLLTIDPAKSTISISHAFNNISFSFRPGGYPLERLLYQYKLNEIDTAWSDWSGSNMVSYTRLPKGDYTFMVRSLLPSGNVSEPLTFRFTIKPYWYGSIMAFIMYGLALMAAILISQYYYRKRIKRQHERMRQESLAKTLIEKQTAEQEIITLQNQNLETQISHKNIQLADATASILKKNELLIEIKNELEKQKEALGNRYPLRYFDRISSLINRNISSDNDWKTFEALFDQAHENFFKRLKTSYPDLTPSDLKLCAYLRLNLSSKEIAPLLNISTRGIEIRRYRLRKRLSLSSDENLVEFILQF